MKPRFIELDLPFSIGDTEGTTELFYSDSRLTVTFRQWPDRLMRIVFEKVSAFRWDDNDLTTCEVSPDRIYQVEGSPWLDTLRESGRLGITDRRVHFRLYFISESSALDVVALSISGGPSAEPPAPSDTADV